MPGYLLHFAAAKPELLKNRSFMIGLEAPDILKKHYKVYGIDGARCKYNYLKTPDMPNYERFEVRVLQKESFDTASGLHYGYSSNPDILAYWNELTDEEKNSPFFRGYLWHLLTDFIMYKRLEIYVKFNEPLKKLQNEPNFEEIQKREKNNLHMDWDKTNAKVRSTYPGILLPQEVIELNVVKYIDTGELMYINWPVLKSTIDFLRTFDPLNATSSEMEEIISQIMDAA